MGKRDLYLRTKKVLRKSLLMKRGTFFKRQNETQDGGISRLGILKGAIPPLPAGRGGIVCILGREMVCVRLG